MNFSCFSEELVRYEYDDGGRAAAGYKGTCGDCGTRAAAIALQLPYKEVYDELNFIRKEFLKKARTTRAKKQYEGSVRDGTTVDVMEEFMRRHGWRWIPKMKIGSGCTCHICDMPRHGRYVLRVAKHFCAFVDGTIRDTFHDREDRCVYGYWVNGVQEVRYVSARAWYITTVDRFGNVWAWVEDDKFVVPTDATTRPTEFSSIEDAKASLSLVKCKSPLSVREAKITVNWGNPV